MNDLSTAKILITGANGHLGKKLVEALSNRRVRALVRSESSFRDLQDFTDSRSLRHVEIMQCDYLDATAMAAAASGCCYAVHLVGVIKASAANSFHRVHVETTRVMVAALKSSGVKRVCYLSLIGSDIASSNPCLASRGEADRLFLASGVSALVLQIPMVLGEGDYASSALRKKALAARSLAFRSASLEQPVYAGDIISAITKDIDRVLHGSDSVSRVLALAGPESLSREALIQRAAAVLSTKTSVFSLPLFLGLGIAWILEKVSASPPISRAMLGVLDHDDNIDPLPACSELDIELTALDATLERTIR